MRHRTTRGCLARWNIPAAALLALMVVAVGADDGVAHIVNRAEAVATYGTQTVTSDGANESVPVAPATPAMSATMTGAFAEPDQQPRAGDIITWTVVIQNEGDTTLTGVAVTGDSGEFVCATEKAEPSNLVAPGDSLNCTGRQTLLQTDLDANGGGDGDIDNVVNVVTAQTGEQQVQASVVISTTPAMRLEKWIAAWRQVFAGTYEIEYLLTAENTGTVRLNDIQIEDDLSAILVEHPLVNGPWLTVDGFSGNPSTNPDYDGRSQTGLLAKGAELVPGNRGEVRMTVQVALGPGSIEFPNRATAVARELEAPVVSDDPLVTPDDATDVHETVLAIADHDGDGIVDADETGDRDGDGVADVQDYDPTGYFYCETDGRILPGGLITVDNLTTGVSQTGIGSNDGITILRDGDDGRYQFQVSDAGRYRLRYRVSPLGIASIARQPGKAMDLTALAGENPITFGSGEVAGSGALVDYSEAANPFHLEFLIGPGDRAFINNNIPLRYCGTPSLVAEASIVAGPTLQGDGRSRVTYLIDATNNGNERVDEAQIHDDLARAFGDAFQILSTTLVTAPPNFAAAINPFFDGRGNNALLTSGGNLKPGEQVVVELTVLVGAASGTYSNTVEADGVSPLDASAIAPARAEAAAAFGRAHGETTIAVAVIAEPRLVAPGQRVTYEMTFTNETAEDHRDVQLIAQMPPGLIYLAGSSTVDGNATDPQKRGGELVWPRVAMGGEGRITLRFDAALGATATGAEFTVYGFVREAGSGGAISDVAAVKVRRDREAVFACAEIAGQVFDDRNRDGYVQQGEPGLAGVEITGPSGLRAVSDLDGRFIIPCPSIPKQRIGSTLALQLDVATLPEGYRLTTPETRSVELARGKVARPTFGAASQRVVTHILEADSFEPGSTRLQPGSLRALANLLNLLEEELSVLRLAYVATGDDPLADRRIEAAKNLVSRAWLAKQRPYPLSIETRIVR